MGNFSCCHVNFNTSGEIMCFEPNQKVLALIWCTTCYHKYHCYIIGRIQLKIKSPTIFKVQGFWFKVGIFVLEPFLSFTYTFKVAKLVTCLPSCLTLDIEHCNVSQCLWVRTKLFSLLLIMTRKPWSFCWLRSCNFLNPITNSNAHKLWILL